MVKRKQRRRRVSDEEFRQAIDNEDNRRVAYRIAKRFSSLLTKDERVACVLQGFWRALQYHRRRGNKFTSSLYRFVFWECWRECKKKICFWSRHRLPLPKTDPAYDEVRFSRFEERDHIEFFLGLLQREHAKLVREYFLEQRTLSRIGELNGYSRETARKRLKQAMVELRGVLTRSQFANKE